MEGSTSTEGIDSSARVCQSPATICRTFTLADFYDAPEEEPAASLSVITAQLHLVWVNQHRKHKLPTIVLREVGEYLELFSSVLLVRQDASKVFNFKKLQWRSTMIFSIPISVTYAFPLPHDRVLCGLDKWSNQYLLKKRGNNWEVTVLEYNSGIAGMLYDRENVYHFGGDTTSIGDDLSTSINKCNYVRVLNLGSLAWIELPKMKYDRGKFNPVSHNRRAYIIGGVKAEEKYCAYFDRYESEKWSNIEEGMDELEVFNLDTHVFEHSFTISLPTDFYQTLIFGNRLFIFSKNRAGSIDLDSPTKIRKEKESSIPGSIWTIHRLFLYSIDKEKCYRSPLQYPFVWTTLLEVTQPQVTQPQVTQPQVTQPQVTQPQVTQPQVTQPQVIQPQVTQPQVSSRKRKRRRHKKKQ